MDEKVIIKSQKYNTALIVCVLAAITLCISVLYFIICTFCYGSYSMHEFLYTDGLAFVPKILMVIFFCVSLWALLFNEIVVTDKRIYGKTVFGKRVDLPLDSVSAIATGNLKSISIATSSGQIAFNLIKNRDEIHKVVSELLINRQSKPAVSSEKETKTPQSTADELKKYKDLLDSGVITQEEFDAKKKQLLGL